MVNIVLGHVGLGSVIFSGQQTLAETAFSSAVGDARATQIIYALNQHVSERIAEGVLGDSLPHPYSYRLNPISKQLANPDLGTELCAYFSRAAEFFEEVDALPHVMGHGFAHHFNFTFDKTDGWTALNVNGFDAPAAAQYANAVGHNPYWPDQYPDAPVITLDQNRFNARVDQTAALTHTDAGLVAKAFYVEAACTMARRVDGTPVGQVAMDYFKQMADLSLNKLKLG